MHTDQDIIGKQSSALLKGTKNGLGSEPICIKAFICLVCIKPEFFFNFFSETFQVKFAPKRTGCDSLF